MNKYEVDVTATDWRGFDETFILEATNELDAKGLAIQKYAEILVLVETEDGWCGYDDLDENGELYPGLETTEITIQSIKEIK